MQKIDFGVLVCLALAAHNVTDPRVVSFLFHLSSDFDEMKVAQDSLNSNLIQVPENGGIKSPDSMTSTVKVAGKDASASSFQQKEASKAPVGSPSNKSKDDSSSSSSTKGKPSFKMRGAIKRVKASRSSLPGMLCKKTDKPKSTSSTTKKTPTSSSGSVQSSRSAVVGETRSTTSISKKTAKTGHKRRPSVGSVDSQSENGVRSSKRQRKASQKLREREKVQEEQLALGNSDVLIDASVAKRRINHIGTLAFRQLLEEKRGEYAATAK